MNPAELRITAEPIDTGRCKFIVSEPLHAGGVRRFGGIHAFANVFVGEHLQVGSKLCVKVTVQLALAEETEQTRAENAEPLHLRLLLYRREVAPSARSCVPNSWFLRVTVCGRRA